MSENRFQKAKLIKFRWSPKWDNKPRFKPRFISYTRMTNVGEICIGRLHVSFRRPWLPSAAYAKGWDAHFRQTIRTKEKELGDE